MKNRTLTFSYLLAHHSRAPSPALTAFARLTGDMLPEKGKTRQSLCRGPEREFLAWFPQRLAKGETIELQRGDLIEVKETELRANEVRIKASPRVLAPDERP